MNNKLLLRKTCGIYASDTHFATMIFPFVIRQIKEKNKIVTIFEKDETEKIEKILENIGLETKIKQKIKNIDWSETNIKKIRKNFKIIENNIKKKSNTNILILGNRAFIKKINEIIDLWFKNNIEKIEVAKIKINIINCFSFYENKEIYSILNSHDYVLKTYGLEKIIVEEFLKAN